MNKVISEKKAIFISVFAALIVLLLVYFMYSFLVSRSTLAEVEKWDGVTVASSFSSGNGTKENPYLISNGSELIYFKNLIEGDDYNSFNTKYYAISEDIDLDNHSISSIGTISKDDIKIFKGSLDGRGHTISNILIDKANTYSDTDYYGLFSTVENATITNLNISSYSIKSSKSDNKMAIGLIAGNINSSGEVDEENKYLGSINNISIVGGSIDLSNTTYNKDSVIGGISGTISSNLNISNIYLNLDFNTSYIDNIGLFSNKLDSDVNNTLFDITSNNFSYDKFKFNISGEFKSNNNYYVNNSKYYLGDKEVTEDDIITTFNENNTDYYFAFSGGKLILKEYEKTSNTENNPVTKKFVLRAPQNSIAVHESGVSNGIVYVNDLESSWNYYMGLNYTEVTSANLPSYSLRYSSSNLVQVAIAYLGQDYNDSSLVGHVSPTESATEYIYYRYYPIVDGKITIELIDNPFSARPTGKGFNGWATSYSGAVISFDKDYYTRYLTIPVTNTNNINITMNAIWYDANIQTDTSKINSFDDYGMKKLKHKVVCETKKTEEDQYSFIDGREYYEEATVGYYERYTGYFKSGNYFYHSSNNYCYDNSCTYYKLTEDTEYDSSKTYYFFTSAGRGRYRRSDATFNILPAGSEYQDCHEVNELPFNDNSDLTGYYYKEDISGDSSLYYNGSGQNCSNTTCSSGNTYKLIQNSDDFATNYSNYDINNFYYLVTRDMNIFDVNSSTNLSTFTNSSKPMTVTGSYDGTAIANSDEITNTSYYNLNNDMVIENIYANSYAGSSNNNSTSDSPFGEDISDTDDYTINANSHNLKIGRNLLSTNDKHYVIFKNVIGTIKYGSTTNPEKYKVIVESGVYNSLLTAYDKRESSYYYSSTYTGYVLAKMVYGSDYDRVNNDNDKLLVYFNALASYSSTSYNSRDKVTPSSDMLVKSGKYGLTYTISRSGSWWSSSYTYGDITFSSSSASGIYVGGRSNTHYSNSLRRATILGGQINALNGGPCVEDNLTSNSTATYVLGGYINTIYGGAATTTTYGNRIVSVTGGTIGYNVFGGSNAYDGGNSTGQLSGHTLIYIGGNSTIGDESLTTTTRFNAERGSVFGAGNGNSNTTSAGKVYSSHVIIADTATINGNVYGGGNYGQVGFQDTNPNNATIDVIGGTITGNIYGAGNNVGAGTASITSNTNINFNSGTLNGSIFGGSRTKGVVYGSSNVNVLGGTINTDVYGGGEGAQTYLQKNSLVNIGSSSSDSSPIVDGSVYGGSAYGTVNATSSSSTSSTYTTNVNVYKGTIAKNVFGGGKGDSSNTPHSIGNITVNVYDGSIGKVFGGFDANGSPTAEDIVYLNGGTIGDAFGGGNRTGQPKTEIHLQGSTVTNLYGGSNESGTVTTSNVVVDSGNVDYIYGGNNIAGETTTTNVTVNDLNITGDIYGGGNKAESKTSNVTITAPKVVDVYGGGREAGVDSTNVNISGTTANKIFGGSNISGDVGTTNLSINSVNATSLYGGNNQGGSVGTTTVASNSSTITDVFGGGDNAEATTSNVIINGGTISNVYGGGNEAGVVTTNVNTNYGTIGNVFGGSNKAGNVTTSNVNVGSNAKYDVSVTKTIEDSGWRLSSNPGYITYSQVTVTLTNNTSEDISKWNLDLIIPNSKLYSNYSSTDITVNGDIYSVNEKNKYYGTNTLTANGGSYSFTFEVLSTDSTSDFSINDSINSSPVISNVYGGNNLGGLTGDANVNINKGTITNVYGGGNEADVNSTKVVAGDSTITDLYGGGNAAKVNESTSVDLNSTTILDNVYGGGNEGAVTKNTEVFVTNGKISNNLFAGGNGVNAVVYGNSTITIDGTTEVGTSDSVAPNSGCVFGAGNAADSGSTDSASTATVNIVGATIHGNVYGGPKMAIVNGKTQTNIGSKAVKDSNLVEGDIIISGTVFGGGESNANGSETYDWNFISVTGGINVEINGNDYIENSHKFVINGSIFGSGNASSSSGESIVHITDLGTADKPNQSISIQRANELVIKSSVIELSGATDRTNEYSDIMYSFNMIDKLSILNNTTLLLQHNANMLKEFYSGIEDSNGNITAATVDIDDDTKKVTKNVNNRLYMKANQNLNVTINQAATAYGKVTGMTFFGMYSSSNGSYRYGLYDDSISYGDTGDAGLAIVGGSYVLGLHSVNHDIKKDGFYSNYLSDDYTEISTKYIDPTPIGDTGYRWVIGLSAINYNITLTASKYSSLGTYELQMIDFADGDTTFTILGFNSEELVDGVSLVDSTEVPRVGKTVDAANNTLGLSVKSETQEWTSYGTTKFLSEGTGKFTGTRDYTTDSRKIAPSLMFYLYHAKNINRDGNMGKVVIMLQAAIPVNEIDYKIQLVTINVDIVAKKYDDVDSYDATITYDKRYEMPATTSVHITNQSQFTAYFSLISTDKYENIYGKNNEYYHVLTLSSPLPVGTMITMLDFGQNSNRPEYYYYEITDSVYNDSVTQLNNYGEVTYRLSNFIKMDSTSSNNLYNDATANQKYYSDGTAIEEFLFIIDMKNSTQTGEHLNNSILFELRNSEARSVFTVLGIKQSNMIYNTYDKSNAILNQTITDNDSYLYYNITDDIGYSTSINYDQTSNRQSIIDTNYESNNMGLNVAFYSSDGKIVSSSLLSSTSIKIDGKNYFADSDGVFRIKLAGKVSNLNKSLALTVGKDLPATTYTMKYTLFASEDGLHNSDTENSVTKEFIVHVVSSDNTITVDCDDKTKVVDGATSLNMNNSKINTYNIEYTSNLNNPSIRVEVYKRDTADIDSTTYTSVPFNNLFSNNLDVAIGNEMLIDMGTSSSKSVDFTLADNLTSGTYRVVFKLYDNTQIIDSETKYVIVKKDTSN